MRSISEKSAIERLGHLKDRFRKRIAAGYEYAAKSCLTCETPGACCLDAHFVNVHISRLEAVRINAVLNRLPSETRKRVEDRRNETIETYGLTAEGDTFARTFACPLYERSVGCLVHEDGKPLPCIQHACYERPEDLPPDRMLTEAESAVDELNRRTYGSPQPWLPLPLAIGRFR